MVKLQDNTSRGGAPMNKNSTSTVKLARHTEEFSLKNATHIGGLIFLVDYALDITKLPDLFKRHLPIRR